MTLLSIHLFLFCFFFVHFHDSLLERCLLPRSVCRFSRLILSWMQALHYGGEVCTRREEAWILRLDAF